MSEPKPELIPEATAVPSSMRPNTGTGADTVGLPRLDSASGVPSTVGGYVLLSELGRGGMGVVYRAEDPRLKREVAIKLMLPQLAANPQAKARFIREARAQAKVEHDHVTTIFQVEEHVGLPYLVMPLLKGMTLYAALKANPRPPLPEVIRIGREMAEGLAAAHEKGLIHRDIKPANIWLEGKKLRVKVLDFGLARIADADATDGSDGPVTKEGAVVGTPAYMSPEQGRGTPVDGRTDLWSLGVVLYQMTTGELPFRGPNTLAVLTALALDNPPPPITKNPAVPPALSDLVMRLLAKDPAYRPQTAEALAEELRAIETDFANSVRVVPLGAPPPLIVGTEGPDPFANLDATEASELVEEAAPQAAKLTERSPARRGIPTWAIAAGVVLAVCGVIALVASQMGKKPVEGVNEPEPPKQNPNPPPKETPILALKYGDPQVEMRFRWVPPGRFTRGDPPQQVAITKGFWLAETECTQAQWRALIKTDAEPFKFKGDDLPVESVTALEAAEFCREFGKRTGKPARFPTEAEWEYACRAGTTTAYHSGNGPDALQIAGWYNGNAGGTTHPVGTLKANNWGLKDMHGNVYEWCLDGYDAAFYKVAPPFDPARVNNDVDSLVVRGGSWTNAPDNCSASFRHRATMADRHDHVGFRVCFRDEPESGEFPTMPGTPSGFRSLFNGKDLTGWVPVNGSKAADWTIKDASLVCLVGSETKNVLQTKETFRDFRFRCEFKLAADAYGKFMLGSTMVDLIDVAHGSEGGESGTIRHLGGTSWLKAKGGVYRGPNQWNSLEILRQGKRFRVTLNGTVVNDRESASETTAKAVIKITQFTNRAELRNLEIELLPDPPKP